jgi:hypothetical protein
MDERIAGIARIPGAATWLKGFRVEEHPCHIESITETSESWVGRAQFFRCWEVVDGLLAAIRITFDFSEKMIMRLCTSGVRVSGITYATTGM